MIDKMKKLSSPTLNQETLQQFSQLKSFIDANLKEIVSKNFESDEEKVKYLHNVLLDLRDFMLTQINDNSFRIRLMQQFNKLEEEELLGNYAGSPEEELLKPTEEK